MSNCTRFKEAREKTGLSQSKLGKAIGLSGYTVFKLENDEQQWAHMATVTADKVQLFFDKVASGTFNVDQTAEVKKESKPVEKVVEKPKSEPKMKKVHKPIKETGELTEADNKTLTLIEFAYEGLKESKNDEEFIANVNLMKRVLSKY